MWPCEQHHRKIPTDWSLGLMGKGSYGRQNSYGVRCWLWLTHDQGTYGSITKNSSSRFDDENNERYN